MPLVEETFLTFEQELERLGDLSLVKPPVTFLGSRAFFRDLSAWLGKSKHTRRTTVLLPEPSLNLSASYPRDELSMAYAVTSGKEPEAGEIERLAEEMGINLHLLDRPTSALSGGERMLVCLGKTSILAQQSDAVCICSPFYWLDARNRHWVNRALGKNETVNKQAHLLVLVGEQDRTATAANTAFSSKLEWHLRIRGLSIAFPPQYFPRPTAEKVLAFKLQTDSLSLTSPTLISGPNGVGKTTLAKLLARVLDPTTGSVFAVTSGYSGGARMVMQDTLLQLFCEDILGRFDRVFLYDSEIKAKAESLYQTLQEHCAAQLDRYAPSVGIGSREKPDTLLQAKLALVAERLVTEPPLLILDEPGWCLSLPQARAFVEAIAMVAHQQNTGILMISHQADWWSGIACSELELQDEPNSENILINKRK